MSLVVRRPSPARTSKEDFCLTPPEEVRAQRLRLFLFLGVVAICALGIGVYFGAPRLGRATKAWQSRRLAREAFALIEQKQWSEAEAKARDAYLLRTTEPEAWRAIARLLSRVGQGAAALEWWKKLEDEHRLTIEDRRDFAGAALTAGELTVAATQVSALLAQHSGPLPVDTV